MDSIAGTARSQGVCNEIGQLAKAYNQVHEFNNRDVARIKTEIELALLHRLQLLNKDINNG